MALFPVQIDPYWESEGIHLPCSNQEGDSPSYSLEGKGQGREWGPQLKPTNQKSAGSRVHPALEGEAGHGEHRALLRVKCRHLRCFSTLAN